MGGLLIPHSITIIRKMSTLNSVLYSIIAGRLGAMDPIALLFSLM
jgi:hypothetical protein